MSKRVWRFIALYQTFGILSIVVNVTAYRNNPGEAVTFVTGWLAGSCLAALLAVLYFSIFQQK